VVDPSLGAPIDYPTYDDGKDLDGDRQAGRDAGRGLLPGTLCVVVRGDGDRQDARGAPLCPCGKGCGGDAGIFFDMNARGDSQQHREYAERLYEWKLKRWTTRSTP